VAAIDQEQQACPQQVRPETLSANRQEQLAKVRSDTRPAMPERMQATILATPGL